MFQIAQCDSDQDYVKCNGVTKIVGSNPTKVLSSKISKQISDM